MLLLFFMFHLVQQSCRFGFYLIGALGYLDCSVINDSNLWMHVSQLSKLNTPGKIPELRVHGSWLGRMQIVTWFSWGMIS